MQPIAWDIAWDKITGSNEVPKDTDAIEGTATADDTL